MDTENHQKSQWEPVAALKAARNLIAEEEHWTRSAPARRWKAPQKHEPGEWVSTHATDSHASRWCAAGALCAVSWVRTGAPGVEFLEAASRKLFGIGIGRANDDPRFTTHGDILRCFDTAISFAEAAGERSGRHLRS